MLYCLLEQLQAYEGRRVFNPYSDCEPSLERLDGAEVRVRNLQRYLEAFAGASYVLVGEAAGYAGCRFSGIPFTGEAQIVGPSALSWARERGCEQSSLGPPWRERSGQIVWETLGTRRDCVLWNAFPWHPFGQKLLSNRRPGRQELRSSTEVLVCMLSLFPTARAYAIGRVSQEVLSSLGVCTGYIRHPSHGGKQAFVRGVASLPSRDH